MVAGQSAHAAPARAAGPPGRQAPGFLLCGRRVAGSGSGSQGFAQGLTSAAGSSCPGPAPARACETRPAAPQVRMLPTAPACHGAQRCPNSLPRARRAGLGPPRAAVCSSVKRACQPPHRQAQDSGVYLHTSLSPPAPPMTLLRQRRGRAQTHEINPRLLGLPPPAPPLIPTSGPSLGLRESLHPGRRGNVDLCRPPPTCPGPGTQQASALGLSDCTVSDPLRAKADGHMLG